MNAQRTIRLTRKLVIIVCISLVISIFFSFIYSLGLFETWQNKLADNLFYNKKPNKNIVIIAIDNQSIQKLGRWPWNRSIFAKFIDSISQEAEVIGLDVAFPEQSTKSEDEALARSLENAQNIVIPIESDTIRVSDDGIQITKPIYPIEIFSQRTKLGIVNTIIDVDGVTRLVPFSFLGLSNIRSFASMILDLNHRDQKNIPLEQGALRINYVGKPGSFSTYSFIDVWEKRISPEIFRKKIVLIGATATDLHDSQFTPISGGIAMSGVEVHANTIQTLLEKRFIIPETKERTYVTILIIALIITAMSIFFGINIGLFTLVTVFIGFTFYILQSFDSGKLRNILYPVLTAGITYIIIIIYHYLHEFRQKVFIKKAFSRYLSESVMKELLQNPHLLSLGVKRNNMTVLFSDIIGFTSIAEIMQPEQLASLINVYLTHMTDIVFRYNGVLDKYIGDAVMAFWGAPIQIENHSFLACKTALDMLEKLFEIKKEFYKTYRIDIDIRIGINTGDMVVGNLGSEKRFDYTVLGDNVNLSSRLEGINKHYGTRIIISASTHEQVRHKFVTRCLDVVAVKGKQQGTMIYELRSFGKPTEKEKQFLLKFEQARKLYQKGDFITAYKYFQNTLRINPEDMPTNVYITRCKAFIEEPPPLWNGIYYATSK